jgi:hypothetical protein
MEKLTDKELKEFKEVNSAYQQAIFDLGVLELSISETKQRLDDLNAEKLNTLSTIQKLIEKQQEIGVNLGEKYGDKQVDLETGELK